MSQVEVVIGRVVACRTPVSFNGAAQTDGGSDKVGWSRHMESRGSGGTATVTCTLRGQSKSATANFSIG